jgi:4-amino-4-deoxy-L-arabinose transferase-like glycosyltransferase
MPTGTKAERASPAWRRVWPEALVAVLAVAVFFGYLGSVELWGKHEQRAAAEAIDTVDHQHWLVAEIQGRPRLEKPPVPRWWIAALMILSGRRDEWVVRLPGAVCGLLTVALVYAMGRRMGGRPLGLAAALVLCSLGFFVAEMRQAGNDGPVALFTTSALFAAWQILGGQTSRAAPSTPARTRDPRAWHLLFYTALGLGILTKGPIILMLTTVAIVPYLAMSGRLGWGLRRLVDGWGLLLLVAMAASWPVAVLVVDPMALRVWLMEVSEKTGVLHVLPHRHRSLLAASWPSMMLPWTVIALLGSVLPLLPGDREGVAAASGPRGRRVDWASPLWIAWWWALGNLVVFDFWAIAKANYYVPCMPGMALLIGAAWVRLARRGRGSGRGARAARSILQAQWVLIFVGAMVAPLVGRHWLPQAVWPALGAIAASLALACVLGAHAWRRGADALSLAPITAAAVLSILIGYGRVAPAENPRRSHRALAETLGRILPHGVRSVRFFNQIDEGLWFYLPGWDLLPVPGSQPRYNTAFDLVEAYRTRAHPAELDARRQAHDRQLLVDWLDHHDATDSYLLLRSSLYDQLAPELSRRVTPLLRETGLKRNELVLLHVDGPPGLAARAAPSRR